MSVPQQFLIFFKDLYEVMFTLLVYVYVYLHIMVHKFFKEESNL
jgi:hypothetical protein